MTREQSLVGRVIAGGIAEGPAFVVEAFPHRLPPSRIAPSAVQMELVRFDAAVARAQRHLQDHVKEQHDPNDSELQQIVAAHLLILSDQVFLASVAKQIQHELMSAETAVEESYRLFASRLVTSRDAYLRARLEDLRDSCHLLLEALIRGDAGFIDPQDAGQGAVFISPNLHASVVLRARRCGAVAFASSSRAFLSHGAILLRAAGLPSLGGLAFPDGLIDDGAPVLLDALRGELIVDPSETRRRQAFDLSSRGEPAPTDASLPPLAAFTADGEEVSLWANIDSQTQIEACLDHRLHGIGLFRTEFMTLSDGWVPEEDEQVEIYQRVTTFMGDRPLVIRTFDIGAEKVPEGLRDELAANPALGLRGLRRQILRYPEELRTQIRAILRGTVGGNAAILFPMVTNAEDLRVVLEHIDAVRSRLAREGVPHNQAIKLASMIEVPAAALNVRRIAELVDFVAIGTNDMSQYLTAADRDNADVSAYLDPATSGIFAIVAHIMREMESVGRGRDVMIAGELASDPRVACRFVVGGVRSLIINPPMATPLRDAIARLRCRQ